RDRLAPCLLPAGAERNRRRARVGARVGSGSAGGSKRLPVSQGRAHLRQPTGPDVSIRRRLLARLAAARPRTGRLLRALGVVVRRTGLLLARAAPPSTEAPGPGSRPGGGRQGPARAPGSR